MAEPLFDIQPTATARKLSAGSQRIKRQRACLDHGAHPLTAALGVTIPLHAEAAPANDPAAPGLRCGTCVHRTVPARRVSRPYPKCAVGGRWERASAGPGTDIRAWWPACVDHEAVPGG